MTPPQVTWSPLGSNASIRSSSLEATAAELQTLLGTEKDLQIWMKKFPNLGPQGSVAITVSGGSIDRAAQALVQTGAKRLGDLQDGSSIFSLKTGVVVALSSQEKALKEPELARFLASKIRGNQQAHASSEVTFRPFTRDRMASAPQHPVVSHPVALRTTRDDLTRPLRVDPASLDIQHLTKRLEHPNGSRVTHVAVGYRKDANSDNKPNARGEDHVAERSNPRHICCVVADGVSSSFYGSIAASHLAEELVKFLWERRATPPSRDDLSSELRRIENLMANEVQNKQLDANIPAMSKSTLEARRREGSQTKFAAVLFDAETKTLWRYQVGDVHVTLERDGESPVVAKAQHSQGAVSSTGSVSHHLEVSEEKNVMGFAACTDGIDPAIATDLGSLMKEDTFKASAIQRQGLDDQSFYAARLSVS